jgi:hypothetical protein
VSDMMDLLSRPRALAILFALPIAALTGPLAGADIEEEIGIATEKGIEFLKKEIGAKQVETGEHDDKQMGKIALETYALIVAGVGVEDPIVAKNLDSLSKMALDTTYCIACYLFALDAAISQLQADSALASPSQKFRDDPSVGAHFRPRLEAAVNALVRIRQKNGGWNYTAGGTRYDNSNSQFAVLGLGVGLKRRVPIPREVWVEVAEHFIKCQAKDGPEVLTRLEYYPESEKGEGKQDSVKLVDKTDKAEKKKIKEEKEKKGSPTVVRKGKEKDTGEEKVQYFSRGWGYITGSENWNMTCGGLSSQILAEKALKGQMPGDLGPRLSKSIRDGYGWLMSHWSPSGGGGWAYYGLYSLEKVADLGDVKKFAVTPGDPQSGHDWFQEVRDIILREQRADGSWAGGNKVQVRWNTAFAMLILNRATSLIVQSRSTPKFSRTGAAGAAMGKKSAEDKNWVYIKEYELQFHVPTILRQMRIRPTPKLLGILELALRNYPPESSGYLVWNLAQALETQKNKRVKEFLDGELTRIVGTKYEKTDQYQTWYKRYVKVDEIGKSMADPGKYLLTVYPKTTKSVSLKKKLIWAIGRCRHQDAAEMLLEDLANADVDVRQEAYGTLSLLRLNPDPIPLFDAKGSDATREGQIPLIKAWALKGMKVRPVAKPEEKPAEKPAEKTADAK